jgi:hypothetical protein
VLRSKAFDTPALPAAASTAAARFPFYVEPLTGEAFFSWLLRLATRLQVSMHTLASQTLGVDDRSGRSLWWCRPHPWLLKRISQRTGVTVARLRRMTFEQLEPIYRDDEASARFAGRRYDARPPERRVYRFAVCRPCLKEDTSPYLRTPWLIGWMAVCPHHGTVLIERCPACHAGLRVAPFATTTSFSPAMCTRCAKSVLGGADVPAQPSVARMQAALWHGKCEDRTEFGRLGPLTWKEMVAFADVLLGTVWCDLTMAEREHIFQLYLSDTDQLSSDGGVYDGRHASLRFLAWLIDGWPDSPGAVVGRSLLLRWLNAERNLLCRHLRPLADPWTSGPHNFEPSIQRRLRTLAGVA